MKAYNGVLWPHKDKINIDHSENKVEIHLNNKLLF